MYWHVNSAHSEEAKKQSDAYELSIDDYLGEMEKYSDVIDEVHSVGGLHPDWDIDFYEDLIIGCEE